MEVDWNIEIERHTKKRDENNKKRKRLQSKRKIGEIRINYFMSMKNK